MFSQALIKRSEITISDQALNSRRFKESNWIYAKDVIIHAD